MRERAEFSSLDEQVWHRWAVTGIECSGEVASTAADGQRVTPAKAAPQSVQQAAWRTGSAVKPPPVKAPPMAFVPEGDDGRADTAARTGQDPMTTTRREDLPPPPTERPEESGVDIETIRTAGGQIAQAEIGQQLARSRTGQWSMAEQQFLDTCP